MFCRILAPVHLVGAKGHVHRLLSETEPTSAFVIRDILAAIVKLVTDDFFYNIHSVNTICIYFEFSLASCDVYLCSNWLL